MPLSLKCCIFICSSYSSECGKLLFLADTCPYFLELQYTYIHMCVCMYIIINCLEKYCQMSNE